MKIFDQLHDNADYTVAEMEIATYILGNAKEAVGLSLDEFAKKLFVSKSTIIRFCKKLGFKGHKEFTVELARELDRFLYQDELIDPGHPFNGQESRDAIAEKTYKIATGAMEETFRDLSMAQVMSVARTLHDNPSVVYTTEEMYLYVLDFVGHLNQLDIAVEAVRAPESLSSRAERQKKGSAALFLSYGGNELELSRCAAVLKEKQIPLAVITGPGKNILSRLADECVRIMYYEPADKQVSIGSIYAMRLILDIIFAFIYNMDYQKNAD